MAFSDQIPDLDFNDLLDVPGDYAGAGRQVVVVTPGEVGLEFQPYVPAGQILEKEIADIVPADGQILIFNSTTDKWEAATYIPDGYVEITGDTMTGDLIMDPGAQICIKSPYVPGSQYCLTYDPASNAPALKQNSTAGTFIFMPDAVYPQILFGSNGGGTIATYLDCDNNGIMYLNALHTGQIQFGSGGAHPTTGGSGVTPLGTITQRWGNAYMSSIDINGNAVVSGLVDGRDVSVDGASLDAHLADITIHQDIDKVFHGYEAGGGQAIPNTGWTAVQLDTVEFINASYYVHSNGEVEVLQAGKYRIEYDAMAEVSDITRSNCLWRIGWDVGGVGTWVEMAGTRGGTYHRTSVDAVSTASCERWKTLAAGDKIRIEGLSDRPTQVTTVANGVRLTLELYGG